MTYRQPGVPLWDYCCSVTRSCPTLCNPMGCSMPGSSVLHYLPEFAQLMLIELVMLDNHLILCNDSMEIHEDQRRECR